MRTPRASAAALAVAVTATATCVALTSAPAAKVDTQVNDRIAATSVSNITGWELWNEPDYTWNTPAAGDFNAGWVRTFQRVRARDTLTPIVGPSTATYNESWMRSFLTHARNTNTLPDIICWHGER